MQDFAKYYKNIKTELTMANSTGASDGKVIHSFGDTYIRLGGRSGKEELLYGVLHIISKADGYYIEWRPLLADEGNGEPETSESWAIVNSEAVGYRNSKESELTKGGHHDIPDEKRGDLFSKSKVERFNNPINFPLSTLRSFKRITRVRTQPAHIIFIQDCGTTHHPIYFKKGGTDRLITQLEKIVIVNQSRMDNDMFLIKQHADQTAALETSFDKLNLFEDTGTAVRRFAADPLRNTLTAFAKFPKMFTEAFVHQDPATVMSPELCDKMRLSIDESESNLPTVNSSLPEDPDFLFVDQKAELPKVDVKPRERPLNRNKWKTLIDKDGRVKDPASVRQMVFRGGLTHDLRCDVWKFLLGYYPWDSTSSQRDELRRKRVDEYFAMKLQWKTMTREQISRFSDFRDRQSLIEKDVNRTDRTTQFFRGDNNDKLVQLNDILMTYVMYNFDLGYVQGMSDLLSPLLLVMDNEVDAFWCFVGYMNLVESNFEMDQSGMKLQLNEFNQILQIVDRRLYNHLDSQDSGNMYFAFRWILILFKREFSMEDIMRLWEVFWTGLPCKNYQLVIATALLVKARSDIIENSFGFTEILKYVNDMSGNIDLDDLLMKSEALAEQLMNCEKLPGYVCKIIGKPKPVLSTVSPSLSENESLASGSQSKSALTSSTHSDKSSSQNSGPPARPKTGPASKTL